MKILLLSATKMEHGLKELFSIPIQIIGVGKVSSCFNSTILLEKYDPELVINFGSCGGLKKHSVGSLINVGKVHNDIDSHNLDEYGKTPFSDEGVINFNRESNIECFTTDYFYEKTNSNNYSKNYKNMIKKCDIIDMELYSVAWCCKKFDKKLISIKWVSDDGNSNNWRKNNDIGFELFREFFRKNYI